MKDNGDNFAMFAVTDFSPPRSDRGSFGYRWKEKFLTCSIFVIKICVRGTPHQRCPLGAKLNLFVIFFEYFLILSPFRLIPVQVVFVSCWKIFIAGLSMKYEFFHIFFSVFFLFWNVIISYMRIIANFPINSSCFCFFIL